MDGRMNNNTTRAGLQARTARPLGACRQRSTVYRRETARDLAQLLVALVVAIAATAIIGRLFLLDPG